MVTKWSEIIILVNFNWSNITIQLAKMFHGKKSLMLIMLLVMITMATDSTEMTGFHLGTFMFCQVGNEVCVNFSVFFKPDGQNPLFGQPWLKRRRIKRKWKMDPVFEKIQQGFLSEFRNKEYQVNCGILYIENMN